MSSESALGARISAEEALRGIVGAEHVRPSGVHDLIDGVPASLVVEPETKLNSPQCCATQMTPDCALPRAVAARSFDWGNPPARGGPDRLNANGSIKLSSTLGRT